MADPSPFDRAFFRETDDGVVVFFPWGLPHRGYELSGESARRRASRAAAALLGATIAVATWIAALLQPLLDSGSGPAEVLRALAVPAAALGLAILAYAGWVVRFVEGLRESGLVIPREQRLREAAELTEPWKIALIGAFLCGGSALVLWIRPAAWWMAVLGIAAGIGVLLFSRALRRASAGPVRHP